MGKQQDEARQRGGWLFANAAFGISESVLRFIDVAGNVKRQGLSKEHTCRVLPHNQLGQGVLCHRPGIDSSTRLSGGALPRLGSF